MMRWDEFRERVQGELGEALFTRPTETLRFVMETWKEMAPEKFSSPLRLSETETLPPDFTTATQQFLWRILESDAETAAIVLWLTLAEWLAGWQVSGP